MIESPPAKSEVCFFCGGIHPQTRCPTVSAIEYYPDNKIKRVEFFDGKSPIGPEDTLRKVSSARI